MIISHKYRFVFVGLPFSASSAISKELNLMYEGKARLSKHSLYQDFLKDAEAEEADEAIDDKVYQVSIGYLAQDNLHFHVGYKKADEENEIKHTLGAMIQYYFDH